MFVKCTSYSDLTKYLTKVIVYYKCNCQAMKKKIESYYEYLK